MTPSSLIVVGGSAGALEPLQRLADSFPSDLQAAVLVVLHTPAEHPGMLASILDKGSILPAIYPGAETPLRPGTIYVAPPDQHLMVADGVAGAVHGPRENGFRPAVDPLFRSATRAYGGNVAGVILSGALDDGSFGLRAIKEAGGLAVVQHPDEAAVSGMPMAAIRLVEVDHILPVRDMMEVLAGFAQRRHRSAAVRAKTSAIVGAKAMSDKPQPGIQSGPAGVGNSFAGDHLEGPPSVFTCPECGGTLWELHEGNSFRFRCHTGHGFTPEALLAGQDGELEHALWTAVRVLRERSMINRQLADRMTGGGLKSLAARYIERAEDENSKAQTIESMLARLKPSDMVPLPLNPPE